ncbi:hypothetical protein NC652_004802 [Populus alba x Populus x berolinensis]|nr:hypothetical protein NC652_004802 [Populus alba x Populus x berolinensis]
MKRGKKKRVRGGKGHSDVPADEMLSDVYYEQDGEDQSDSVHYRGFSQSVDLSSRLQKKPVPIKNNVSRRPRGLHNSEEDDPDDADFDPDYGIASGHVGDKDKDWEGEDSDEDNNSDDLVISDGDDGDDSYYTKKPKSRQTR